MKQKFLIAAAIAAWVNCGIYGIWLDNGNIQRDFPILYRVSSGVSTADIDKECRLDRTTYPIIIIGGPIWATLAALDAGRLDQGTFQCPDPRFVGPEKED